MDRIPQKDGWMDRQMDGRMDINIDVRLDGHEKIEGWLD